MTSTTATGSAATVRKGGSVGAALPTAFAVRPLPGGFGAEIVGLAVRDVDDASFPASTRPFSPISSCCSAIQKCRRPTRSPLPTVLARCSCT